MDLTHRIISPGFQYKHMEWHWHASAINSPLVNARITKEHIRVWGKLQTEKIAWELMRCHKMKGKPGVKRAVRRRRIFHSRVEFQVGGIGALGNESSQNCNWGMLSLTSIVKGTGVCWW
jgi:hypothetical protein